MFEQDYFAEDIDAGPGRAGAFVGTAGAWGLHLAKVLFLLYSGYHGVSASLGYAGSAELAKAAQIFGIVVLELTLFSLYLAWHNQKITGTAQMITAGATYSVGFVLACLGIVADSQLHAGVAMSPWLVAYLRWGLPVAPAVMALGALLTHELNPHQLRSRQQSQQQLAFAEDQFTAQMAAARAEMDAAKALKNMQLNARMSAARQIAAWYSSDEAQQAITATALQNAPALLRAIGIEFDGMGTVIPGHMADDGDGDGEESAETEQERPVTEQDMMDVLQNNPEARKAILDTINRLNGQSQPRPTQPRPTSNGRGQEP